MENGTEDYDMTWPTDDPNELCDISPVPAMFSAQTCIHSIICSAENLIGNILVIATYAFYKRTKTMTDVYLLNVALADLIFVVALPLIVYNEQEGWSMGVVACKILRSAYSINLYSGTLLLACISCDRYVAIVQARRSFGSRSHSLTYSRLVCSAVWVLAGVLTLPTLIFTKVFDEKDVNDETVTATCLMHFSSEDTAVLIKLLVPSFQMAVGFLLPLLVMAFCYSCIAHTLLRAQSSERHKALRVVVAVVVVFIACHLPYNVALLLHTMSLFKQRDCAAERIKVQALEISRSVAYLHCCLNPILYAFIGVKFRSHFLQIISDLWCFGKRFVSSSRSSCGASDVCTSGWKIPEGSNMSSFSA
ncbi:LOW QUALITY PROTEIN: C-C chemokine receptor type 6-like [Cololabis saira]|uniref:LOW QUALITY PROTEIN: C-C chemokine receptor type 6-like n=1 Tax=Cololabis saira TaxID=129043 RepID=UPI002AD27B05|nr:LOW QUALITY PROTEIN: C-C chemokine receptor type 6-like [Cololabis saira]